MFVSFCPMLTMSTGNSGVYSRPQVGLLFLVPSSSWDPHKSTGLQSQRTTRILQKTGLSFKH